MMFFSIYFDIVWWVSSLVFLGLRSLIGLIGLSVGLVGLSIFVFVCWWGLVFDGISCVNDNQVYRITGISSRVFISFSVLICFGYVGAC